ncbi:META domain-containing protein [Sphingobacterium oryzagri]|uniref:META domain-containing protein n=1 Tax=Sphingobacterium oryzagri TaxID=3025669 RepID=A0ABY7WIU5_9SPHI|nr:META domain-containing protein [Sphingobacterium sp. KACC 22765]WDF69528.1 META domain-containing protein [Sphingobacterium sp. KACC 22765]
MRIVNIGFLMVMVFLFASCASRKTGSTASTDGVSITGQQWQLIELKGKAVPAKVNGKMPYLLFSEEDGRYSATGGCNGIGGEYTLAKNNGLKFSKGMSTMMACENMEIENGLRQVFEQASRYAVDGNSLLLYGDGETQLAKFVALVDQTDKLTGTWELDYVMEPGSSFDSLYAAKKPTITFDVVNMKLNGNSSCNNFSGKLDVKGNQLNFGPMAATRMACPGAGEQVFFNHLERVNAYDVQGDTLTMIMGDIVVMRWKRK